MGRELGRRRLGLVYGGGSVGLMGALARAAQEAGSNVVGVIPESLTGREMMGDRIGELIVVETMHERKALMASLADAFLAIAGRVRHDGRAVRDGDVGPDRYPQQAGGAVERGGVF